MYAIVVLATCALSVHGKWVKEMENKGLYQGDIQLRPDEKINQHGYVNFGYGRWPNGEVPYVITSTIGRQGRAAIDAAIQDYHKYTCLRFKQRTTETAYINFVNGGGCSSPVAYRQGQVNTVTLAPGCWYKGTVMHEIGHSIGLEHEQCRPDRNNYITVQYQNIQRGMAYNFDIARNFDSLNTLYDYESMMHYGQYAFSRNRQPTIITKDSSKQSLIGNRNGFSSIDIVQINRMYKCNGGGGGGGGPRSTVSPSCTDKYVNCQILAQQGHCKNSGIKTSCCKSCGQQPGTPAPTTAGCTDKYTNCPEIAKNGHCIDWGVQGSCCKSCRGGGGGGTDCKDQVIDCDQLRNNCNSNDNAWEYYMKKNCKKTCGFCV